jgi:PAS domain S-box-containing protein
LWVLAFQIVFLLGSLASVFALAALRQYNAFYLCFLPLIWIALTHGLPGATLATLATTMAGLVGMHYLGSSDFLIISFLLFELAAAAVGLGLGAIVTMRNESQRLLAEHKERFERVIAGSQLGLWDWDVPGRHISCNRHWAEMIGQRYEHLDFHYEAWEKLIHPADRERVLNTLTSPLFGAASLYEIEYRLRCSDQQWRWFVLRGSVITRNDMGHPLLFSGTHMDITDRKRAEAEARRLLRINEATTDFIITTDISGGIVYANTAFLKMQKVARKEDLSRGSLLELMPAWASLKLREEAMTAALSSGAWTGELALRSPGAKDIPVSMVALGHHDDDENEETSFSFIMRDISEQRLSETARLDQERRLLQFQKLESLGVLAGGIAHDFNNLLTVVLGNASLARFDLPSDSSIHAPLGQIESAAISAAELCQQMLAYAGRSPLMFRDIDCVQLVEDTTPLLEVTLFKHHRLDFQLTRPIPLIQGDAAQLRLAITNLVINASEAIGDREGTISIRVKPRTIGAHEIAEELGHISLIPGRYVVLQIEDTGRGMAPEELAKIFDPFYSTKQSGHGLGLASVLGIVKSHGGEIHVASTPGAGSCFDVFLPALSTASPRVQPSASERATPKGNGFILVADDDAETRTYIVRIFENLGYSTIQACNGLEALEHCRTIGTKLRIAFIDLTMPMMNGEEAFHQLRAIYPSLPVVLMSDSEEKWLLERFVAAKPAAFIAKPIDVRALQTCIDQLLR